LLPPSPPPSRLLFAKADSAGIINAKATEINIAFTTFCFLSVNMAHLTFNSGPKLNQPLVNFLSNLFHQNSPSVPNALSILA
jgi:hypothetical protein